jgi:hypothetical protein
MTLGDLSCCRQAATPFNPAVGLKPSADRCLGQEGALLTADDPGIASDRERGAQPTELIGSWHRACAQLHQLLLDRARRA